MSMSRYKLDLGVKRPYTQRIPEENLWQYQRARAGVYWPNYAARRSDNSSAKMLAKF